MHLKLHCHTVAKITCRLEHGLSALDLEGPAIITWTFSLHGEVQGISIVMLQTGIPIGPG